MWALAWLSSAAERAAYSCEALGAGWELPAQSRGCAAVARTPAQGVGPGRQCSVRSPSAYRSVAAPVQGLLLRWQDKPSRWKAGRRHIHP